MKSDFGEIIEFVTTGGEFLGQFGWLGELVVGVLGVLLFACSFILIAAIAAAAGIIRGGNPVENKLSRWQRIKRRVSLLHAEPLLHGEYKYPDGTMEFDFEARAGIVPFVDDEIVKDQKLKRHFDRLTERNKALGGFYVAAGVFLLAWQLGVPATLAIYGASLIGYGLWRLSGGEKSGDYA